MSDFLSQFSSDPDPDMASFRRIMFSQKPIMRDAVVTYAPPYPEYPELFEDNDCSSSDPSCPSARHPSEQIEVAIHDASGNGFGPAQQLAWEFFNENLPLVESSLRAKLFAQHQRAKTSYLAEDMKGDAEAESYWQQIKDAIDWDAPSSVDHVYKLVGIGLVDTGLDECGFVVLELQTGWDRDHGMSILMHKGNTLASGGMGQFTFATDLIAVATAIQSYDLDHCDLPLK